MLTDRDVENLYLPANASSTDRGYLGIAIAFPTTPQAEVRVVDQVSGLMANAIRTVLGTAPKKSRALDCFTFTAMDNEEDQLRARIVRASLEQIEGIASNRVSQEDHKTAHDWFAGHLAALINAGQFEPGARLPTFLSRDRLFSDVPMTELRECAQGDIESGKLAPESSLVFHPQTPSSSGTLRQLLHLVSRPKKLSHFPIILTGRTGANGRLLGLPPISPQGSVDIRFINQRRYPDVVLTLREETEQGLERPGVPIHALFIE